MIRTASGTDAEAISAIYNHYISHTSVTFELEPVGIAEMAERISGISALGLPWLVAETAEHGVIGYAYASQWRARPAYRHSVEITVYLAASAKAQGWGSKLYECLFSELQQRQVHAVIGGIALPNDASIALHEKFGMTKVAHFSQVGFKFGQWLDVGYWQRLLT